MNRDERRRDFDELHGVRPDDPGEVCHCGLGPEDHTYPGAAEHNYVPRSAGRPVIPCTKCGAPITYHAKPVARFGPETGWFCDTCGPRGYDA